MRTILLISMIVLMTLTTINAQAISGKFVRFGANSVVIKTENDILNLPISPDLIVIDDKGQKVSPSSLFENADITIKYEDGLVKAIVIDKQTINYIPYSSDKRPEYNLIYRNHQNYNYNDPQAPVKISYVGYLPLDYQSIVYPSVDVYNAKINFYNYVPVNTGYTFGGSPSMANEIKFYDNMLANNLYSPRYYYEVMSSVKETEIPNYYYISKLQEKSNYFYKKDPNIQNSFYYANNNTNTVSNLNNNSINNDNLTNTILGTLLEVKGNKLVISSDRIYEVEINGSSNIFVKKGVKYIPLNTAEELKNMLNKKVEMNISFSNNRLVASTIVIETQ